MMIASLTSSALLSLALAHGHHMPPPQQFDKAVCAAVSVNNEPLAYALSRHADPFIRHDVSVWNSAIAARTSQRTVLQDRWYVVLDCTTPAD